MTEEAKAIQELMKESASKLREHADSVQIFCTHVVEDGDTEGLFHGSGDLYARVGIVSEWRTKMAEIVRIHARKTQSSDEA